MDKIERERLTDAFACCTLCYSMTPQELRRARRAMSLTQKELAERLQMTRTSVARMERGEQKIMHVTDLAVRYLALMQNPRRRKGKK